MGGSGSGGEDKKSLHRHYRESNLGRPAHIQLQERVFLLSFDGPICHV